MSPVGLWGGREVRSITPDDIRAFLAAVTEGLKRSTKRHIREKGLSHDERIFQIRGNKGVAS